MAAMIDYWYYTGDTTYNKQTTEALLFQAGDHADYMPTNQTLTEGNDDQGFWAMSVMSAAEYKFPDPPTGEPGWLALAQAVFNTQAPRWDTEHCNGGLRWQIFAWNSGYNYKNSITQATFFTLAARLALYTDNSTYADWAVKTWDWMVSVNFIDEKYNVYDGAHVEDNCKTIVPYQFSYNPVCIGPTSLRCVKQILTRPDQGAFLLGAAAMYAYSDSLGQTDNANMWRERIDGLLDGLRVFFHRDTPDGPAIMFEVACEPVNLCDVDQQSFKAYLSRWMAATTKWAPWTYDVIKPLLANSAVAAARACTGGDNHRMCGLRWVNNSGAWDGSTGVGQQMAAMEVVLANMMDQAEAPVTNRTGGTSVGNPSAGSADIGRNRPEGAIVFQPITAADRAGGAILTIGIVSALLTAIVFMVTDETKTTSENIRMMAGGLGGKLERALEKGKGVEDPSSTESGEVTPSAATAPREQPPTFQLRPPKQAAGGLAMKRTSLTFVEDWPFQRQDAEQQQPEEPQRPKSAVSKKSATLQKRKSRLNTM